MNVIHFFLNLYKQHPKRLPLLTIILILSGILESIGIGAIIPIFEFFFQNRSYESNNLISNTIYEIMTILQIPISLPGLFTVIIGLFFLKSALSFTQNWLLSHIVCNSYKRTSALFVKSLLKSNWIVFQKEKHGNLLNIFSTEIQKFSSNIFNCINFISEFCLLIFYLCLSCLISLEITLISIILLSITIFPLKVLNNYIIKISEQQINFRNILMSSFQESLNAFKWIKVSSYQEFTSNLVNKKIKNNTDFEFKSYIYQSILPSFFILFSVISLSIIAYISLVIFRLTFSEFLLVTIIFYRIYPKFQRMQTTLQSFYTLLPSKEVVSSKINFFLNSSLSTGTKNFDCISTISFKEVNFKYNDTDIIKNLSISINKNEFIGIIGPSGCGKSTFIDLVSGLLIPQSGDLSINEHPLNDINLSSYQSKIGIVSQDLVLFNESILGNLTWGLEDISNEEVYLACKKAHCLEFIDPLPEKYNTIIGERGIKLSGGQKQRLALARELLKKPQILILDEATSALDSQSEKFIHESILELKGQLTLIVVSHRLSTVKKANIIYVMQNGQFIENGSWSDLSKKDGIFKLFKSLQILE